MPKKTTVWVFAEQKAGEVNNVSLQLVREGCILAYHLGGELQAVLMGYHVEHLAATLGHYGVRDVYVVDNPILSEYNPDAFVSAFVELIRHFSPFILLMGSTSLGRDLAPRLAARLRASYVANCTALTLNEDRCLMATKPIFGGKLSATIVCTSSELQIATILPGEIGIGETDRSRQAQIVRFNPRFELETCRTEMVNLIKADPKTIDLTEAEIIVVGGKGMGDAEHFSLIQQLADALGGAVAGSRESLDAGWISFERQVGLTGETVSPKLVISCGISGQYPYTVGIEGASIKIAINTDANAPIFRSVDLGVLGNVREVIPALIKELGLRLDISGEK